MFEKVYGVSCIENQVLNFLCEQGYDITKLYINAFMQLKELYFFVGVEHVSPYNLKFMPRIQDVLKKENAISFSKVIYLDVDDVLQRVGKDELVLMGVNQYFTKNILRARGFKKNHVVRIEKGESDRSYNIINDIPFKIITIGCEEIRSCYSGEAFILNVMELKDRSLNIKLATAERTKMKKWVPFHFVEHDMDIIEDVGGLRDAVLVHKILRNQLLQKYSSSSNKKGLEELVNLSEKTLMKMEYSILKNYGDIKTCFKYFNDLNEKDNQVLKAVREEVLNENQ